MSQGFGPLGRELEALANRLGAAEIEDEGEDLQLRAAEGAQDRIIEAGPEVYAGPFVRSSYRAEEAFLRVVGS